MKSLILTAGRGSRLEPFTQDVPKSLVPLFGKPILEHQIKTLRSFGISDINAVVGYRAGQIGQYISSVFYNPEYNDTNMVYSMFCAETLFKGEQDLLVSYGDILFCEKTLLKVSNSSADVSVAVDTDWLRLWKMRMENPLEDAETMRISSEGKILELGGKTKNISEIQGQYIGLFKISMKAKGVVLQAWKKLNEEGLVGDKSPKKMYMTEFIQHLIDLGLNVEAITFQGGWVELDTLKDLEVYTSIWISGKLEQTLGIDLKSSS